MAYGSGKNDALIFTDGWVPDARMKEKCPPGICGRIGAVIFHQMLPKALCFQLDIPEEWAWGWEERSTQIILVELIAPVIALYTWQLYLLGRTVLLFNVSSTAENMLVRGYSNAAPDANGVVAEFWSLTSATEACFYVESLRECPRMAIHQMDVRGARHEKMP